MATLPSTSRIRRCIIVLNATLCLALAACMQQQSAGSATTAEQDTGVPGAPPDYLSWSGVWKRPDGYYWGFDPSVVPGSDGASQPPHRPEWLAQNDTPRLSEGAGGANSNCLPVGMPAFMNMVYLMELQATDKQLTIISEYQSTLRRIYLDGRDHPESFYPNFHGHSIGHWDGDTLVVDTIGLRVDTFVPHSDQMRIEERFRLLDPDTIEDQMTVHDPLAFNAPWTVTKRFVREPDFEIGEYVCEENNRNPVSDTGATGFIHKGQTLPPDR